MKPVPERGHCARYIGGRFEYAPARLVGVSVKEVSEGGLKIALDERDKLEHFEITAHPQVVRLGLREDGPAIVAINWAEGWLRLDKPMTGIRAGDELATYVQAGPWSRKKP